MWSGSRPWLGAVLGLAVALMAACGDGSGPDTSGPTRTTRGSATTTTAAAEVAPDFALELGNGGTFVLSEEARPVFMVFWAEW